MPSRYSIKDLERISGIKAHTLRIWEQRYNILHPERTQTNIRYYSNEELKTILNIALLNKYGFKISHIDRMSVEEIREDIAACRKIAAHELIFDPTFMPGAQNLERWLGLMEQVRSLVKLLADGEMIERVRGPEATMVLAVTT